MLTSGLGKYVAPTSLGAGYAIAKMISLRVLDSELAIAQDFTYQFLAGVLLAFALRPVANMIYWKLTTAIVFFTIYLLILGPVGQILRHMIWGNPFDNIFWLLLFPEVIAAFTVSILVPILLPSQQKVISLVLLWKKLQKELNLSGLLKLFGCGLLYTLLFFILHSTFDESFTSPFWMGRLQELLSLPPISVQEKIMLLWGQGILNTLILLPLFLVFFREKVELIVVFGSLSFVVAVFSPAFANFQRIEPLLLVDQVFIGFCLQFLFVASAVFCFGRNEK
ncbi:uncharacterized protein METZ01_LOCUS53365 [marine metagenome]|uniref:Uncharacterized protein n=1 Tax=marine metagenome TaxID=408172 RepID=A0A381SB31_9ZZZZ